MDITTFISFMTGTGMVSSLILNWVQYRNSKRGNDLSNFEKQIALLEKLQSAMNENYQSALKNKDLEIEALKSQVATLNSKLERYTQEFSTLQGAVNRLIGDGCKKQPCGHRIPYPTHELVDILGSSDDEQ